MRALSFTTLAILVAFATLATADHCTTWTTSAPEITLDPYYVEHDICQPCDCCYTWVYQETNDIPGLQREDETVDDTCHGMIAADTIVL